MIVIGTDVVENYLAGHAAHKGIKAARSQYQRLIPLTQARLYVVGASIPPGSRFCVDCLA